MLNADQLAIVAQARANAASPLNAALNQAIQGNQIAAFERPNKPQSTSRFARSRGNPSKYYESYGKYHEQAKLRRERNRNEWLGKVGRRMFDDLDLDLETRQRTLAMMDQADMFDGRPIHSVDPNYNAMLLDNGLTPKLLEQRIAARRGKPQPQARPQMHPQNLKQQNAMSNAGMAPQMRQPSAYQRSPTSMGGGGMQQPQMGFGGMQQMGGSPFGGMQQPQMGFGGMQQMGGSPFGGMQMPQMGFGGMQQPQMGFGRMQQMGGGPFSGMQMPPMGMGMPFGIPQQPFGGGMQQMPPLFGGGMPQQPPSQPTPPMFGQNPIGNPMGQQPMGGGATRGPSWFSRQNVNASGGRQVNPRFQRSQQPNNSFRYR